MAAKLLPPISYLRECLDYNPKTGMLIWKERPRVHFKNDANWKGCNARLAGTRAGSINKPNGYRRIHIGPYGDYLGHRIIWALQTGSDPGDMELDHYKLRDNRWANLRLATRIENVRNNLGWSKKTLPKGVYEDNGRYQARITVRGCAIRLGRFATPEKAASVYRAFARSLHGRFYADPTQT